MQKKGIELSINFFVIIVLSVAVFGIGMKLLFDMCTKVGCFGPDEMVESCSDEKVDMLLGDSRAVVCPSDMTIAKSKSATFKVGILNSEQDFAERYFRIIPEVSAGIRKNSANIDLSGVSFSFSQLGPYVIKSNADKKALVQVFVPSNAPSGTYSVDVKFCSAQSDPGDCSGGELYAMQKMYIEVP